MKKTKNPNKILNKQLKEICSKVVKQRDNYTCVKCKTTYPEGSRALTCSHFWSSTKWPTKWDLDNLDTLCLGCHTQAEHDKQGWYMSYKLEQLGPALYAEMEIRANQIAKWSQHEKELMLEQLEAKYEQSN